MLALVGPIWLLPGAGALLAAEPLPKVLLIGDSICSGYHKGVEKALAGKAVVARAGSGGRDTRYTLEKTPNWLGDGKWDVIHFNWGLWDMRHALKDGAVTYAVPIEEYEANLRKLVAQMKSTGARLIWASTTPVLWDEPGKGRTNPDVIRYNEVAARVMKENGVAIDDLYSVIKPRIDELQSKAYATDVHYNEKGNQVLIAAVTKAVETALGERTQRAEK